MQWGCWVELEDKDVHCKEWEYLIENFTEEEADTTMYQIYGQIAGDQRQVQYQMLDSRTEGKAYAKLKYAYSVQKCGVCSEHPWID